MTTTTVISPSGSGLATRGRVRSVDALRGLVVTLMIIVNTVAEVPRVPWFTQHLPASVDGYSLADMIVPWFLFLVGVSLPLALGHFVRAGRRGAALGRIVPRVAGLLLLGVIFINSERIAPATGIGGDDWLLLCLTAMMVLLIEQTPAPRPAPQAAAPENLPPRPRWDRVQLVKATAALALIVLLVIYRGQDAGGGTTWLRPQWWGILGIIGWAYLVGALAFLLTRGQTPALAGLLGLSVAVAIGSAHGRTGLLSLVQPLFGVHEFFGSFAALVLAGAIAGSFLVASRSDSGRALALLGALLWSIGWYLRPLHGYHKLGTTESWALVGAGQAALALAIFHLGLDAGPDETRVHPLLSGLRRIVDRPARWLGDAGSNALLAYLLSEIQDPLCQRIGIRLTPGNSAGGIWALLNAALLTGFFIAVAAAATRHRVRLRL